VSQPGEQKPSWWQRLWSRGQSKTDRKPRAAETPRETPPGRNEPDVASERDVASIEVRAGEMLAAGEPDPGKALFCILQLDGEGLLTITGGATPALVIFSPPVRAFHYGKLNQELQGRQLDPSPFALGDWPRLADACQVAGVGGCALNPSPRGTAARIYTLDTVGTEEGLQNIWVTERATREILFERKLAEAEAAHEEGDRRGCLRRCEEIVQHVDDLRPEVYVLLGQSAFADGDTAMLSYAYERLREFDGVWREQLQQSTAEHAAGGDEGDGLSRPSDEVPGPNGGNEGTADPRPTPD